MRARLLFLSLATGALLSSAAAQTPAVPAVPPQPAQAPPPGVNIITPTAPGTATQRVRGTVQDFDGPFLTLKLAGRKTITLGMTGATRIVRNRLMKLTDLQPGWYVGVEAIKGSDGKLRAQAIRVYPAAARGTGEGLYPAAPDSPRLIVGGSITAVTPGGIGGVLSLSFHGAAPDATGACVGRAAGGLGCSGAADIQFARGVPIMAIEAGDGSQLLPGATVSATTSANPDGTLVAVSVTIERDPIPKEH
jgi:Domain of unknown function (DUF5666)